MGNKLQFNAVKGNTFILKYVDLFPQREGLNTYFRHQVAHP